MIEDVQQQFQQTLNQTLFDPMDKPFPIRWNQSPPEEKTFTLDEFKIACIINGDCTLFNEEEIKNILTKPFSIIDESGNNMLDKTIPMNCRVVPICKCKKNAKCKCDNELLNVKVNNNDKSLNKLLFLKDHISESDILSGFDLLTKGRSICQITNGKLTVKNPTFTTEQKDKLELGGFCIIKTLQFLRNFTKANEGDYNELYHLSNCKCHSGGWKFLVGDRILTKTKNIELFDVMAFNEELGEVYLLHTKDGADTSAIRECSSQVRVCSNELKKWYCSNKSSILSEIYDAMNLDPSHCKGDFIHRLCAKQTLNANFKDAQEFIKKIRRCSIRICLALADKIAFRWHDFKYIDFHCSFENIIDVEFLNKLKQLKLVKPDNCMDMQRLATLTPKQFKSNFGGNFELYQKIFKNIAPNIEEYKRVRDLLTSPSIPKMEIVILNDNFNKTLHDKISLCVMPINTGD